MMEPDLEPAGVAPRYLALFASGELARRAEALEAELRACRLCPRQCGVDRSRGERGACGVAAEPQVASITIHPWEEPPISGTRGSGTIFFSGCTLNCCFCQNYPISQMGVGRTMDVEALAAGMLRLQRQGAHNLNLVTGTHQMAAVVRALTLAVPEGLRLPLVHNTSGYERVEILRLLDGVVDIYLPDIKYADPQVARRLSGRADYVAHNRAALIEMWRQVGPPRLDADGIATGGMIVRHLVLPEDLSGTRENLRFLAERLGREVWVSLMNQYFPAHRAHGMAPLDRKVSEAEYSAAMEALDALGLENGFVQDPASCVEPADGACAR